MNISDWFYSLRISGQVTKKSVMSRIERDKASLDERLEVLEKDIDRATWQESCFAIFASSLHSETLRTEALDTLRMYESRIRTLKAQRQETFANRLLLDAIAFAIEGEDLP